MADAGERCTAGLRHAHTTRSPPTPDSPADGLEETGAQRIWPPQQCSPGGGSERLGQVRSFAAPFAICVPLPDSCCQTPINRSTACPHVLVRPNQTDSTNRHPVPRSLGKGQPSNYKLEVSRASFFDLLRKKYSRNSDLIGLLRPESLAAQNCEEWRCSCQLFSNMFGTSHDSSWGTGNPAQKAW